MSRTKSSEVGPLQRLMLAACPPNPVNGRTSLEELAGRLGCTRQALHKWCLRNMLEPALAMRIVEVSEGRVTLDQFDVFVYVDPSPSAAE